MTPIKQLEQWVRPDILRLKPYASARDEFQPVAGQIPVYLDANENSLGGPLSGDFSRYPDPGQTTLKQALATRKGLSADCIFLGNGSDEAIDLLIRTFCEPGRDEIIILPPTYGMYAVQAAIQGATVRKIPLLPGFVPDVQGILREASTHAKILFLCSPNNPTGNQVPDRDLRMLLEQFQGLVVVDEAYVDFAEGPSVLPLMEHFSNLVVLQTFSKAWGLAGLRIGMAFAHPFITGILNKIKYPYNLNAVTVGMAAEALTRETMVLEKIQTLLSERNRLSAALTAISCVEKVFPSEANFLLVRVKDADATYAYLRDHGVVVRNRSREMNCENCLRITVGKAEENDKLLELLGGME